MTTNLVAQLRSDVTTQVFDIATQRIADNQPSTFRQGRGLYTVIKLHSASVELMLVSGQEFIIVDRRGVKLHPATLLQLRVDARREAVEQRQLAGLPSLPYKELIATLPEYALAEPLLYRHAHKPLGRGTYTRRNWPKLNQ